MIEILMRSAKMATSGLLKIKVSWNKGYYAIHSFYEVTNKILSYDSNYIVDVVMRPKFGNSSICMREVIITSILMMMKMRNCFCGMVDRRKSFSLISNRDHCQRSLPSQISNTLWSVWTCAEPEFRITWMKLCSSDNHYTIV